MLPSVRLRPQKTSNPSRHGSILFDAGKHFKLGLIGSGPFEIENDGATARFVLKEGETRTFLLRWPQNETCEFPESDPQGEQLLAQTTQFWRRWLGQCTYQGRWREMVHRSVLALKLLTFKPTGAIVASPTTSLPEEIGGERNWDYRYTWIRDAAFTIYAFLRIGFTEEAAHFMDWLLQRIRQEEQEEINGPLNVMYRISGEHEIPEETLDHLEGYMGSRPVRVGNAAYRQLQLDVYGKLIDSIYLYDKYATAISYDLWLRLLRMLDWVAENWQQPDEGIWEVRSGRHHFTFSKMQCWVALDRGLRMALKRGRPINREKLERARDEIYRTVMEKGFNPERNAFVQYFGSNALDASLLLMPLVLFISPKDPRMLGTLDAIMKNLVSDSLVYRYEPNAGAGDGLRGREGTFSMCTFWLVEALTRAGRVEEARFIFEKMLTYANHLGLYAEEIGPSSEALGNFPQALTHLALISAAYNLDRTLSGKRSW